MCPGGEKKRLHKVYRQLREEDKEFRDWNEKIYKKFSTRRIVEHRYELKFARKHLKRKIKQMLREMDAADFETRNFKGFYCL